MLTQLRIDQADAAALINNQPRRQLAVRGVLLGAYMDGAVTAPTKAERDALAVVLGVVESVAPMADADRRAEIDHAAATLRALLDRATTPPLALTGEERESLADAISNDEWEAENTGDLGLRAYIERRAATLRALLARATTTGEGARGSE